MITDYDILFFVACISSKKDDFRVKYKMFFLELVIKKKFNQGKYL